MTDLYLDLEWFFNQEIFLIGYAYSITQHGQLHDETLTMNNILQMLEPVDGYIYFYGPDIGMLEKATGLDIRNNFRCVNLLKVFRDIMPGMDSYKLASLRKCSKSNAHSDNTKRTFSNWWKTGTIPTKNSMF